MPSTTPATVSGDELSGRNIIEKEQRPRALDQNVVDAMIDQIATDRVVNSGVESDLQFGADAVGGSDQHRLAHIWKRAIKHAAEAANL